LIIDRDEGACATAGATRRSGRLRYRGTSDLYSQISRGTPWRCGYTRGREPVLMSSRTPWQHRAGEHAILSNEALQQHPSPDCWPGFIGR